VLHRIEQGDQADELVRPTDWRRSSAVRVSANWADV